MFLATPEIQMCALDSELLLGANIDLPRSGTRSNARAVTVAGWVVGRHAPVREVHVLSSGGLVRRVRLTQDRPDVAAHFKELPGSLRSGFFTTVDASAELADPLEIRAVLNSGTEVMIGRIRLHRSWLSGSHRSECGVASIVIPCFNHAHFLVEAIESCLQQTYPRLEIVVIDDGSTDNTEEVVSRFPAVRYVHQTNQGLASARNAGIRRTNGEYLVFLDADDRLVPAAVQINVELLQAHPDCAFASGEHCYIGVDGVRIGEWTRTVVDADHYEALLRGNYIGCPAAVTFRRGVFQVVGSFDSRLNPCEDYDLYLRIARLFPVCAHGRVVAEYRRYGSSMSDDAVKMLAAAKSVLHAQKPWTAGNRRRAAALAEGLRYWQDYYGPPVAALTRRELATSGRRRQGLKRLWQLARYAPGHLTRLLDTPGETRP